MMTKPKEVWECEKCGKEFSSEKSAQKHESLCEKTKGLVGVDGWLWWSALVLTILSPAMILMSLSYEFSAGFNFLFMLNILIVIASITTGIMIFSKYKKAILFAKGFYLAAIVISIIDILYYFYYLTFLPPYFFQDLDISEMFRGLFVSVIWFSYFNLSRRVKNTFKETKLGWKIITLIVIASSIFLIAGVTIEENISSAEISLEDIFTKVQLDNMDNYCSNFCSNVEYAKSYTFEFNFQTENMECLCIDDSNSLVETGIIPESTISSSFPTYTFVAPTEISIDKKIELENLSGGYVSYYPFLDETWREMTLRINSSLPLIVHFVLSEQDYQNFMKDFSYKKYEGCSFYNQKEKTITCNVSTGGFLVYNPNTETATYSITTA